MMNIFNDTCVRQRNLFIFYFKKFLIIGYLILNIIFNIHNGKRNFLIFYLYSRCCQRSCSWCC